MSPVATRVATYTRISKDRAGDAHGVANQQTALEQYATARNWTIVSRHTDNDLSASNGKHRPGFDTVMRLVDGRQCDVVLCWAVDRFVRRIADLESVIGRFQRAECKLAAVSGDMDLSSDAGRTVARMLSVIAQGEVERKSARQKLAAEQAAKTGKRWTACPRPFGFESDHVTHRPAEARAIRVACRALLGGSSVTAIARHWNELGLRPSRSPFGPLRPNAWSLTSVKEILLNPRIAALNAYNKEITGPGNWEPIVDEPVWRAVVALLRDPARKPSQGVTTLLGGIVKCRCGNALTGGRNQHGTAIYRCNPSTRISEAGPHIRRAAAPVDDWVEQVIVGILSRPDFAGLVMPKSGADVPALTTEAAAIRRNLDELAADRALGLVTRTQMLAATERGNARLSAIAATMAAAATDSALSPFLAGKSARRVWDSLDQPRKRAVIRALCTVTLHPAVQGSRAFDPETVIIVPKHQGTTK